MNLANKITLSRILLIPFFMYFVLSNIVYGKYIAALIFIIAAGTDSLDGYIARSRKQITTFGKFIDPIADKLLVTSALITLVQLGKISSIIAMIIISREFIISGFRLVAISEGIIIPASWLAKLKTITQMVAIVAVLLDNYPFSYIRFPFSEIALYVAVLLTLLSGIDYIVKSKHLIPIQPNSLLNKQSMSNLFSLAIRTFNISESEIQHLLQDLIIKQTNPIISTFSETYRVTIYLTVTYDKNMDPELLCNPLKNEIEKRVGRFIYGFDNDTMESVVVNKLLKKNVKIAIAESCTGGLIISRLITISGISNILMEGLVTYSNQSKILRLHVKPETLQQYGAVSEETAKEMAIGLLQNYGIDMALSVTGIAGPNGGSVEKPVGLVYICIASKKSVSMYKHQFSGDRENIREMSCMFALDHIRLFIAE